MKQALINLINAVGKYNWYVADPINVALASAKRVVNIELKGQYAEALEALLEAIPGETEDADWQSDELKQAINEAEAEVAINSINALAFEIEGEVSTQHLMQWFCLPIPTSAQLI
jgi:hypothetical protein